MAHFAEIGNNDVVVRVVVTDNDDPNGDEGYQWLVNSLGGRWVKCSYNTYKGVHTLGGTPLRWTYPGPGSVYIEDLDIFIDPSPYPSWIVDKENKSWKAPKPKPDSGLWYWSESTLDWKETEAENYTEEQFMYYSWVFSQ